MINNNIFNNIDEIMPSFGVITKRSIHGFVMILNSFGVLYCFLPFYRRLHLRLFLFYPIGVSVYLATADVITKQSIHGW